MTLPGPGTVSPYARPKPPELDARHPQTTWHIVVWKSGARTAFRNAVEARMIAEAAGVNVLHSDDLP